MIGTVHIIVVVVVVARVVVIVVVVICKIIIGTGIVVIIYINIIVVVDAVGTANKRTVPKFRKVAWSRKSKQLPSHTRETVKWCTN